MCAVCHLMYCAHVAHHVQHPPCAHTHKHTHTPLSSVFHACRRQADWRAGPGEEKMECDSSFSVSGWQGFSCTPSHSSNEVIKWMNEAWKETCCWGQCIPKKPLSRPATFCLSVLLCLRTVAENARRSMRQFLQCVCNIFISPGWHTCSLLIISVVVRVGLRNRCKNCFGSKDLWNLFHGCSANLSWIATKG